MKLRFSDLTFDSGRRLVHRGPDPVRLSPKEFRLLEILLERRPDAVAKAELMEALWPDVVVSEASLTVLVNQLREALGEAAREPRLIRTVFGFGYAFEGTVHEVAEALRSPYRHVLVWGSQELELAEGENLVGREHDASIWIRHPSVSREHARVRVAGGAAELEDLGSKNGTYRGSERVTGRVPLRSGDEVRIGTVSLRYACSAVDASAETETAG